MTKFNLGGGADASVVSAVSTRYLDIVIRLMMDMMVMMVFWHIPIMVGIRDARPAPRKNRLPRPTKRKPHPVEIDKTREPKLTVDSKISP